MRIISKITLTITLGLCFLIQSVAQSNSSSLELVISGQSDGEKVFLRWAPKNYSSMIWGRDHGYNVFRYIKSINGEVLPFEEMKSTKKLIFSGKPFGANQWEGVSADPDAKGVAEGALWSTEFSVADPSSSPFIQAYNTNLEMENRLNFALLVADQDFDIALASALGYVDNEVEQGYQYMYMVEFNDGGVQVKKASTILKVDDVIESAVPDDLDITGQNKIVCLSWSIENLDEYSSYVIERSPDNQIFNPINDKPVLPFQGSTETSTRMFIVDTLTKNNKQFYYRVKGLSAFGVDGPYSETVSVITKRLPVRAARINGIEEVEEGKMTINWDFDDNPNRIKFFEIHRSDRRDGNFVKINSGTVYRWIRSYTDDDPLPTNYYKIVAVDKIGVNVESFSRHGQINDKTPPPVPEITKCSCDTDGLLTVKWAAVDAPDLKGYRAFLSNHSDGNYVEISNATIVGEKFDYQIFAETLSEKVYVKLSALDYRENESDKSISCEADRPDLVAPSDPVLLKADPASFGILLDWVLSSSNDVIKHEIQRNNPHRGGWKTILEIIPDEEIELTEGDDNGNLWKARFKDEEVKIGEEYQYRILAFDEEQNVSSSNILIAKAFDAGLRGDIFNLAASISSIYSGVLDSQTVKSVLLDWDYDQPEGLIEFLIFRGIGNMPVKAYRTIRASQAADPEVNQSESGAFEWTNATVFSFVDDELGEEYFKEDPLFADDNVANQHSGKAVKTKRKFTYKVMAKHFDGGFSELSDPVSIYVTSEKFRQ